MHTKQIYKTFCHLCLANPSGHCQWKSGGLNRGYKMATRRYKIYLWVLINISQISAAHEWNISQNEKINFASPSDHVIFFLLYKIFTIHNDICGNFLKISKDFSKLVRRPDEQFRTFPVDFWTFSKDYRKFPKIAKDDQRRSEDVSIIHQQL